MSKLYSFPCWYPKPAFQLFLKEREFGLCLQMQKVFLPLDPLSLILKWSIPSLAKWNDTLGMSFLNNAQHKFVYFWLWYQDGFVLFFLPRFMCYLFCGEVFALRSWRYLYLILSCILEFPWGISLCTPHPHPQDPEQEGDGQPGFSLWPYPRPALSWSLAPLSLLSPL